MNVESIARLITGRVRVIKNHYVKNAPVDYLDTKTKRRDMNNLAQDIADVEKIQERLKTEPTTEQVEWFDDRYYKVIIPPDGKTDFYPSVTTVLGIINKPFLNRWRADIGKDAADERSAYAKWRGSRIHDGVNKMLLKNILTYTDESGQALWTQDEWLCIVRVADFYIRLKPQVKASELIVVNHEYRIAGTCDFIFSLKAGKYDNGTKEGLTIPKSGLWIGDLKTGEHSQEHYYQVAAYAKCIETMWDEKPVGTFLLSTKTTAKAGWKMDIRTAEEVEKDFQMYLHAAALWNEINPNASPKIFTMPAKIDLNEVQQ